MRRVISLFLCLVMCISVFSATATPVFAANQAESIFTVEHTEYKNDRIAYTISINPNQTGLIGAIIKVDYDNEVLELSSDSGAVGYLNDYNEFAANVTGYYEDGITTDGEEDYAVAYMNPNGFNIGEKGKAFIKVAFKVIGEERPETTVKFYCEEYITDDGVDSNDIKRENGKQEFFSHTFFTLDKVENLEVASAQTGLKFSWSFVTGAEEYVIRRRAINEDGSSTAWEEICIAPAGTTEYIDTTRVQGVEYFYTAEARNSHGSTGYDETGLPGMDFGTITEISTAPTERGALIRWGALNGAESYTVYRNTDGETDSHGKLVWKKVGDDTTATELEDEPLTSGVKYYYTVKAHKGKYNAEASVDPASITFISNASIVGCKLNFNDIVINWPFVDGAVSYEIYKKVEGEFTFEKIGDATDNSFADTDVEPGKTYFYQVRSIAENGDGSVLGETGYRVVKLPFVTNVAAALGEDHITVSWAPAELAENYILYRKTTSGNWIRLTSVPAAQTKFDDTVVSSGVTYVYAVVSSAQGFNTELSEISNPVYFLSAPEVVGVFNGSNGMEFKFKSVEGAQKYNIYRREANGQFGEPVGTINQSTLKEYKYIDSKALSGIQYVYGVQSVYGDIKSAITESDLACCLDEPKFKLEAAYDGVKVSWNAVRGAEEYRIYSGSPRITEMDLIATVKSTSFIDKNVTSGRNNYYAVEAVCGDTISTKTQDFIYYLSAPKDVKLESTKSYVQLKWTDVLGADQYIIYRKVSGSSTWTKLSIEIEEEKIKEGDKDVIYMIAKDTTAKAGNKYVYTVVSSDGEDFSAKNETGWSISLLKAPTIKSVANYYGGPKISWGKVSGASKYKVYRKTSKSGKWSYIGSTKSTSYVDKSAKSDKKYYYAVTTVSGSEESGYSSYKTINYLAAPVVKVANETSTAIKVSWGKVTGAQKYEVYRKEGSAKKWTKVKTTSSRSYTDKKVKNGKTYKYMVKAIDGKIVSGYDSDGESIKRLAAPTPVSVKSSKSGVTFKWKKVTGASGYIVYRKTGSGSYKELKKVKGSTKVSYVDKSAKKGKTYTYMVKAYSGSSKSANKSGLKIKDKY